jgi:hypothetical protein
MTSGQLLQVDSVVAINLTALGITATKEQLDFWYSVWQQNHKLGMRVHRASGNDIPLAVLNNQSLNQVFVGGALFSSNFDTIPSNVSSAGSSVLSIENNTLKAVASGTSVSLGFLITPSSIINTNNYYAITKYRTSVNATFEAYFIPPKIDFWNTTDYVKNNSFATISGVFTSTATATNAFVFRLTQATNFNGGEIIYFDDTLILNLTSLGIATLTKSQLDYLFQVWQFNQVNALVARQFIQEA